MKSTITNEKYSVRTSRISVLDFCRALWIAGIKWERVMRGRRAVVGVFSDNGGRDQKELEKITGFSLKSGKASNREYFYILKEKI